MQNNRIYQLNNEQINSISSDLIEAIVLMAGTSQKKGILDNLDDYNKNLKSVGESILKLQRNQQTLNLVFNKVDENIKIQKNHLENINSIIDENFQKMNKEFLSFFSQYEKGVNELEKKLDERIKNINFDSFEKQIQKKLDEKIKTLETKMNGFDEINKQIDKFSDQSEIKLKNAIENFNEISNKSSNLQMIFVGIISAITGAGAILLLTNFKSFF